MTQIYEGEMIFNSNKMSKNNKKYFNGKVKIKDGNGNFGEYQITGFRSQVIKLNDLIGDQQMRGLTVNIVGEFKENNFNGNTTMQLLAEKITIDSRPDLNLLSEQNNTSMPIPPSNAVVPNTPQQQIIPVAAVNNIPNQYIAPVIDNNLNPVGNTPQPVAGGYVVQNNNPIQQPVGNTPQPVAGGYVVNQIQENINAPQQLGSVPPPTAVTGGYVVPTIDGIEMPVSQPVVVANTAIAPVVAPAPQAQNLPGNLNNNPVQQHVPKAKGYIDVNTRLEKQAILNNLDVEITTSSSKML